MGPILIVEDNEDLRELYCTVLRDRGYEVIEAGDGRAALEILTGAGPQPALVLLDLMLPILSGAELLRALEASQRLDTLPVVAISAGGSSEDAPGARYFLKKPDGAAMLVSLAEEFCGKRPRPLALHK